MLEDVKGGQARDPWAMLKLVAPVSLEQGL